MNVESWCTVELNSKQDWLRANRKHNPSAFASSAFKGDSNQHHVSRLVFGSCVPEKHKEKRHFPDKADTQLK
ncbi:protein SPATA45 homolog [Acropora palmata]|uniref:protein SPATA45 homolog n=1 Tax=Acropora palmata TaxID=6131 RepID=UPI003DA0A4D5